MLSKMRNKNEKGFTLIELMIVIAIIGILAAIAIPNFLAYRTKGQDSAAKNFFNMSMAYYADGNTGTVTCRSSGALDNKYNPGNQVDCAGTMIDDGSGTITVNALTFRHTGNNNYHTLTSTGDVESPPPS